MQPTIQYSQTFLYSYLSGFASGNIVGNLNLARLGTADTGATRIIEKVFGQSFREWSLKV